MQPVPHLEKIQTPPITEVKRWIAGRSFPQERPLVDLCQAIPSYSPAPELIEYMKEVMSEPSTYIYSPDEGLPEVREEVAHWYQRQYKAGPSSHQLCLTIGASQAFWLALTCLCQPDDEVIVQLPAYFDHLMGLQTLGIKPIFAPFDPTAAGRPNIKTIEKLISNKTKAILLVTPSNPTGAIIDHNMAEDLFQLAAQNNITLILDETYNAFIGKQPHQLFSHPDWTENFIHIGSFGKTFALTGLRCGALIASENIIEQALKVQDSMVVCQSRPAQLALAYGCRYLDNWVAANTVMMQQRHDSFKEQFLAADLDFKLSSSGSFFAWIKHPWTHMSGRQVAKKLSDESNLICLPGEAFGSGLESYLRLAFGNIVQEQIPMAISRFKEIQL
jgi:aspartate/methionine/tyrosine aminotransferase